VTKSFLTVHPWCVVQMIDGKSVQKKLIGSDDERAVSPVIGVILMVAITVILAAVIAAFVLDMGGSQSAPAQAGVTVEGADSGDNASVTLTDLGSNTDKVVCVSDGTADGEEATRVGDTFNCTIGGSVVAVSDDGNTTIRSNIGN
jgi:flagellin-like protein